MDKEGIAANRCPFSFAAGRVNIRQKDFLFDVRFIEVLEKWTKFLIAVGQPPYYRRPLVFRFGPLTVVIP
jgi:hypothetical protein